MAGLKQSQLNQEPISFWTFDDDIQGHTNGYIFDEIGNKNPLIIHGENFQLGFVSLNDLEVADQYSCYVAPNGKSGGEWINTYFECIPSIDYDFTNIDNSQFSIEFLYYKNIPSTIRNEDELGYRRDIISPLIYCPDFLNIRATDYFTGDDRLSVNIQINDNVYTLIWLSGGAFGNVNHVVITHGVVETDNGIYSSTLSLYVNGIERDSISFNTISFTPTINNSTSSIYVAGNTGNNPVTDFQTELLKIDQIAIYSKSLSQLTIANHYRKLHYYKDIIKNASPKWYLRFDDLDIPGSTEMKYEVALSGITSNYYGQVNKFQPGPDNLIGSHSIQFDNNAVGYTTKYTTSYNIFLNSASDFTIELWFKSYSSNQGILFTMTEDSPWWDGITIWLNSKDNKHEPGSIQLSKNIDITISSDGIIKYNDDKWHYIVARQTGTLLELFVDNIKIGFLENIELNSNGQPSQFTFMGKGPGDLCLTGQLSEFAAYQRALQDIELYERYLYATAYKIQGFTFLQGNPISAKLRYYDHTTGELVGESHSDPITGEYSIFTESNRFLDVISMIPDKRSVRYRIHGPVRPFEINDAHI